MSINFPCFFKIFPVGPKGRSLTELNRNAVELINDPTITISHLCPSLSTALLLLPRTVVPLISLWAKRDKVDG